MTKDDRLLAVADAYASGTRITEIMAVFRVGPATIRKAARLYGVPPRGRGVTAKYYNYRSSTFRDELVQGWLSGEDVPSLARRTGATAHRVRGVLRGAGVYEGLVRGSKHHAWKGGKTKSSGGYIRVYVDRDDPLYCMADTTSYAPEHRIVMARHLGRPLTEDETVHHIDGNKTNNSITNLQLRRSHHGQGQAYYCADCGSRNTVPCELKEDRAPYLLRVS